MGSLPMKSKSRLKRKKRIRKKISGTSERPRLTVFRSSKHIYAQVIDDIKANTLVSASTLDHKFNEIFAKEKSIKDESKDKKKQEGIKISKALLIGKLIAERALSKGIKKVVFDRSGYIYHGRVKAVSTGARNAGLEF
jgi:large subunit ribosomal protein L18